MKINRPHFEQNDHRFLTKKEGTLDKRSFNDFSMLFVIIDIMKKKSV